MEDWEIDELLYRIIDGYTEYEGDKIYDPRGRILSLGKKAYAKTIRNCFDILDDKQIYIFLCESLNWDIEKENKLKALPKEIEECKVKYYQDYYNISVRKTRKTNLEYHQKLYSKLSGERNKYIYYTREGIANAAMWLSMIEYMYKGPRKMAALSQYHKTTPDENDIRSVALCGEWMTYICMNNPFGKSAIKLTTFQRQLLSWTRIYKNIRSNPDCPKDKVIEDHDAFDGWLILEGRKSNAKSKDKHGDFKHKHGKFKQEPNITFYPYKDKEEAKEIFELNDAAAKQKIRSLSQQIEKQGVVKEGQFDYYRNTK